ncbi:MAG: DNA polymerase III subunit gamma/tau [Lentimicrobiaceae bacterium]|nr:DNA polymerase III subunit gamma/tau [Lentimicrobiaceae bacterium]
MDNFIVSARKYRPVTFDTVIGQKSITNTLKNAINNKQLAQAFLFCGPRGVGKTTCARILAKTINCENLSENAEPCNQCPSCLSFNTSASFNIHELDAASNNSVDDIRSLVEQVRIPPQIGKYKVYIIDEVHMLSASAFNAFLKTLEEPPAYAKFILATTEKHKILPTILSRCQIFDFRRLTVDDIVSQLAYVALHEHVNTEPDALHTIAQKADGAMRDALSIFDQIVSSTNNQLTYEAVIENLNVLDYEYYFRTTDYAINGDISNCLLILNEIIENGFDGQHFLVGLGEHLRNLLVCKDEATLKLLEVSSGVKSRYAQQSAKSGLSFLIPALEMVNKCDVNYKASNSKRLSIELLLMQLCNLHPNPTINQPVQQKQQGKPEVPAPQILREENKIEAGHPVTTKLISPETAQTTVGATNVAMPDTGISITRNMQQSPAVKKVEETQENYNVCKDFTQKEMEQAWKTFADSIAEENPNFFATLTKKKPKLKENYCIELQIDNKIQEDEIFQRKPELLGFLHKTLNNNKIQITILITKSEDTIRPYTPIEKLNALAEKNPLIKKFKEDHSLELDF